MSKTFRTRSKMTGFRLDYMEILNWGTFDQQIFSIAPEGNNSLLTGANASGKSTFIDALLTLLVPVKKDRFYNQSSGVEKKGDRTEESYVLGHYGNILKEGTASMSVQQLRSKADYSVILVSFSNADGRQITLFQVRWFVNGELKRTFGIGHLALHIKTDFTPFDAKGDWKKRLKKTYNDSANKQKVEFPSGPTTYAGRITDLFGMRSEKALTLFNQIVGVKVLDNLDTFIRQNMLEEYTEDKKNAEETFQELKTSFLTLTETKRSIEKAKEQIRQLIPIDALAQDLQKIEEKLQTLQENRAISEYWFTQKGVELGEIELEKCKEALQHLERERKSLRDQEQELEQRERSIALDIERDEVGNQIKEIERELRQIEQKQSRRSDKLADYNIVAQKIDFEPDPDQKEFFTQRERAKALKQEKKSAIEAENENLRHLKNKSDELESESQDLLSKIKLLEAHKTNLADKREFTIRQEMLLELKIPQREIPFVGELIKVKSSEDKWEAVIEKILHSFALRMIVPEEHYAAVNRYVNSRNLRGRIRYERYKADNLGDRTLPEPNAQLLPNKVLVKSDTPYRNWIIERLFRQFNFTCVENLAEFERQKEMAVTQNGLIKYRRGSHEKDDRPEKNQKRNYVLGWDNQDKIKEFRLELRALQAELKGVNQKITASKQKRGVLERFREDCTKFLNYEEYDQIDWQTYAMRYEEKRREKEALERTNDRIKLLQKQKEEVVKKLKTLKDVTIRKKESEIFQQESQQKSILQKLNINQALLKELPEAETHSFESRHTDLQNLTYAKLDQTQREFLAQNTVEEQKLEREQRKKENQAQNKIRTFKEPSAEITERF
ncbi:MAG: ATP-binding protein, partial [Bacteroidota bacterium]